MQILQSAHEIAAMKSKYNSSAVCDKIQVEFHMQFGHNPYDWQLNVGKALVLGLDCSVIVGTGAGKTMPFIMPILANPTRHVQ